MPGWPISSSISVMVCWARLRSEVKPTSNVMPCGLELAPGGLRLGDADLGEVDVLPAGEQVLEVPLALAVTGEYQQTIH